MSQVSLPGATWGVADGERADFQGGGEVVFLKGGREAQGVGDVVETVRGVVGGKKRGGVDVEIEKIANGVGVLGAIEAMKDGAAGVGVSGSGVVELRFERGNEVLARGGSGLRHADGRHGAGAQLTDDLFPGFGDWRMRWRGRVLREPGRRF